MHDATFANSVVRRTALENLRLMKQVLDSYRATYWICCGTLLGCVRDGDLISHDSDIDVAVPIRDCSNHLVTAASNLGLKLKYTFGRPERGLEYSFHRRGVKLDVFAHYQCDEGQWMGVWSGSRMARYQFPKLAGIEYVDFCGIRVPIPTNAEEFIEAQYGASWKVPQKRWDYFRSPHNIRNE
jgi:phosphorylcholine metabolism protein LicD